MNRTVAWSGGLAGLAAAILIMALGVVAILARDGTTPAEDGSPTARCDDQTRQHDHAQQAADPCQGSADPGATTFVAAANSWVDDFNRGATRTNMGAGYQLFDGQAVSHSEHFRQNDHWMVDIDTDPDSFGGATMRPDQSFTFENGKLVIEADAAAGMAQYEGSAWVELGVSTAPAPTGDIVDHLYAYGLFGGENSFGCRLQPSRVPVCALYAPDGTRTWEMSNFQWVAPNVFGGYPANGLENAWRVCGDQDPDINCRDRFRLELTKTSVVLYVNGQRYFEQSGGTLFPDELVNGKVYVYFSDWVYKPTAQQVRFHWDRLAVNPGSGG